MIASATLVLHLIMATRSDLHLIPVGVSDGNIFVYNTILVILYIFNQLLKTSFSAIAKRKQILPDL